MSARAIPPMSASSRPFYHLSHAGGDRERGPARRWGVEFELSSRDEILLSEGGTRMESWQPAIARERDGPVEDMPWTVLAPPMVSDRLRLLLEDVAPGHIQFLPMIVTRRSDDLPSVGPYWLMNCLRVIDCVDRYRSKYQRASWHPEAISFSFYGIVIDDALVPPDCMIFIPKYEWGYIVIRRQLRVAMRKAGITGPQFYFVAASSDPTDPAGNPWVMRDPAKDFMLPPPTPTPGP